MNGTAATPAKAALKHKRIQKEKRFNLEFPSCIACGRAGNHQQGQDIARILEVSADTIVLLLACDFCGKRWRIIYCKAACMNEPFKRP